MELPEEFLSYFSQAVPAPEVVARFEAAMSEETPTCVRFNPSKIPHTPSKLPLAAFSESELVRIPWAEMGFWLEKRPVFTLDPLFHAGAYYVQDASSMFVGAAFREVLQQANIRRKASQRALRVLDLCAAPGGKTTDLAASLRQAFGDNFLLVANEVVSQRAGVLKDNVCVWGDPNVVVSSSLPTYFSGLKHFFDIILVDAPCSGEGMFRKEAQALSQWTSKEVQACATRQKSILEDIYPALAEDGYLLYSTCTYNRLENEEIVEEFRSHHGLERVDLREKMCDVVRESEAQGEHLFWQEGMVRFIPGLVRGEGQFCALLQTPASSEGPAAPASSESLFEIPTSCLKCATEKVEIWTQDEMKFALPAHLAPEVHTLRKHIKLIGAGVKLGEQKGKNWLPAEDFALNLLYHAPCESLQAYRDFEIVDIDTQTALHYLHGDSFSLPHASQGTVALRYQTLLLGFVKNLGARCNNSRPKSRRIKMDIV